MKEPARFRKATSEPRGMAPMPVAIMAVGGYLVDGGKKGCDRENLPTNNVAGTGQLSLSLTLLNSDDKGTALSRARAQ